MIIVNHAVGAASWADWLRALAPVFIALVSTAFALWLFRVTAPVVNLTIEGEWVGDDRELLLLRLGISNDSRVEARISKCLLQILEHEIGTANVLSEWVDFVSVPPKDHEQPKRWNAPMLLEHPPEVLFPGERCTLERLHQFPAPKLILHVGFQVSQRLPLWQRRTVGQENWTNTRTAWILKGEPSAVLRGTPGRAST